MCLRRGLKLQPHRRLLCERVLELSVCDAPLSEEEIEVVSPVGCGRLGRWRLLIHCMSSLLVLGESAATRHDGDRPCSSDREVGTSRNTWGGRRRCCAVMRVLSTLCSELRSRRARSWKPTNHTNTCSPSRTGREGNMFLLASVTKYARIEPPFSRALAAALCS